MKKMMNKKQSTAKSVSIMAMSAALYAVFFFVSYTITLPNFTLLYLPIILLGIFPLWFGWSGLAGSMIGALIGGIFVEGLGFFGIFEVVVAIIIYMLNWILMPRNAAEKGKTKSLIYLAGVYALTLFVGLSYLLWQYNLVLPQLFSTSLVTAIFLPTYAINLPIVCIICPALIRAISPKLKTLGTYTGNFGEWRNRQKQTLTPTQ